MAKKAAPVDPHATFAPPGLDAATDDMAARTLIERSYAQLRNDIIDNRWQPGAKLRVEHLRQHYGVSAGTLREALTRLVSDALVEAEGQRGFRVAPVTMADLEDLTDLRVRIEIDALRCSISRADAGWRQRLEDCYAALSRVEQPILPSQARQWEALNTAFHEALVADCGSAWTLRLLRLLARQSERYRRFAIQLNAGARDVHAEHRDIYEAAMSGNALRAALALEHHIRATPEVFKHATATTGQDAFADAAHSETPPSA